MLERSTSHQFSDMEIDDYTTHNRIELSEKIKFSPSKNSAPSPNHSSRNFSPSRRSPSKNDNRDCEKDISQKDVRVFMDRMKDLDLATLRECSKAVRSYPVIPESPPKSAEIPFVSSLYGFIHLLNLCRCSCALLCCEKSVTGEGKGFGYGGGRDY